MGFISSSASFTRFRIIEPVPDSLWPEIPSRLHKYGFKDIDHNADERSFGWVCFDDMLDPEWKTAPPEKGGYLAFALRLDTRRIAPAVFKKHFRLAREKAEQEIREQGRKYLSRDRKKEISEQVRLKLMARSLPIPAVFDVAWNIQRNTIYLGSTRSKVQEMFVQEFIRAFDLHLEPMTPYTMALNILGPSYQTQLDDVEAACFV